MFLKEGIDKKAFAAGEKALKSYAMKNGGVDKADFMDVSKILGQISRVNILQAGQLITNLNRKVSGMDTDVRERIYMELKKVGLMESTDVIAEKMTEKQMKKREEIVKSMKKNKGDFEDRYGADAKDVMYATATKMAMDEDVERRADVKMVKVRLPDGTMVMRRQRPEVKIGETKRPNAVRTEDVELDENAGLIKDYQGMKAQGKKDSNILDALMSMPKYKRMSKDQMAKIIGDAKRKGIFKEEVELEEAQKLFMFKTKAEADKKAKEVKGKVVPLTKQNFAVVAEEVELEEEKDTHKTKDGRTAKKGLYYYINQKKKRGEAPAPKGDPDRPTASDFKAAAKTAKEEVIHEGVLEDLQDIVKRKAMKTVKFADGRKTPVDMTTANAMLQVYNKLNDQNKKKFADGINKSENMFMKMVDFAFSGGKKK